MNIRPQTRPSFDAPVKSSDRRAALQRLGEHVLRLRGAFDGLERGGRTRSSPGAIAASAESQIALDLLQQATPATLTSTDGFVGPPDFQSDEEWSGSSSASITVGGTYDGSLGTDTLTFEAQNGGIVGLSSIQIDVLDGSGTKVDSVSLGFGDAGDEMELDSGLTVAFSGFSISNGDTFTVDVQDSTTVDADAALDDGALSDDVSAGEFTVNGATVAIGSGDSLNDVLASIEASAAGVSAAFDAATSTLTLTQNTGGAEATVEVSGDSTGFLAAVNLDDAVAVAGEDGADTTIDDASELDGIVSGSFSINGTSLSVDTSADSLDDVIERINDADLGVTASFDSSTGLVRLTGGTFTLDDGDSNLFSALGIDNGEYAQTEGQGTTRFRDRGAVRRALGELARSLNAYFAEDPGSSSSAQTLASSGRSKVETALRGALSNVVDDSTRTNIGTSFGFDFDFGADGDLLKIDEAELDRALKRSPKDLVAFLHGGSTSEVGLLDRLKTALDSAGHSLLGALGPEDGVGLSIDLRG